MQTYPVYFAPDIDTSWTVNPGALTGMAGFAPLQSGHYGSLGGANYFGGATAVTGTDHLTAFLFRKVSGAVRLLTFRRSNIDEYDNAGALTNRGTGYTASAQWSAAAWGDQIIACNYLDATQSSTGAGFTALGGSSPKARYVAANLNFVMLADVDDSGSNVYSDMVWWSALQNPLDWVPALRTQAGNIRLLDAPGPIRQIVAFRDTFVVFKDNAIFVGEYVGPSGFIFQWRLVSSRIGLTAPKGVIELDGKLYFLHSSGFYEYDGQTIRNIGLGVFQSFMAEGGYLDLGSRGDAGINSGTSVDSVKLTQATADDIEGVVWFRGAIQTVLSSKYTSFYAYGYNPRSGKWGRSQPPMNLGNSAPAFVRCYASDIQDFKVNTSARFLVLDNSSVSPWLIYFGYPIATTSYESSGIGTGLIGSNSGSNTALRVGWRTMPGTDADTGMSIGATGYATENKNVGTGTSAGSVNAEFDQGDVHLSSRFHKIGLTWSAGKKVVLAGIGIEMPGQSRR